MSYKKGKGRVTLKSYFEAGEIPTEGQFQDFIDSNLNKTDDDITINTVETDRKTAKYMGIGSTNPQSPISVTNKTGASNLMGFENVSGKEEWQLKINPDDSSGLSIQNNENPNAAFLIDPSGKVGIGTNKPAQVLSVQSQENDSNISIKNSKTLGQGALIGMDEQQDLNLSNLESGDIKLGHESNPNQVVVKQNGKIGIGTNHPEQAFSIHSQDSDSNISIKNSNTLDQGAIIGIDDQQDLNLRNLESGDIKLGHESNPSQMVVKENGAIGIGLDEPQSLLHVAGDIMANGKISSLGAQVQRDFIAMHTTVRTSNPIHIKTNIKAKSNIMYRILVEGYNYGVGKAINSDVVGYTFYKQGSVLSAATNNYAPGISISQYMSGDAFLVIKLNTPDTYYLGFSASAWFTNPTGNAHQISANVFQQAGNL